MAACNNIEQGADMTIFDELLEERIQDAASAMSSGWSIVDPSDASSAGIEHGSLAQSDASPGVTPMTAAMPSDAPRTALASPITRGGAGIQINADGTYTIKHSATLNVMVMANLCFTWASAQFEKIRDFGLAAGKRPGCLLLGDSGVGKSILMMTLEGVRFEEGRTAGGRKQLNLEYGTPPRYRGLVGNGTEAHTVIPRLAMLEDAVFIDPPGWTETRNETLGLINCILLRQLLEAIQRRRIVLVLNYKSMSGAGYLANQLQSLNRLSPDFAALQPGFVCLFSHLEAETDAEAIIEHLDQHATRLDVSESVFQQNVLAHIISQLRRWGNALLLRPHLKQPSPEHLRDLLINGLSDCQAPSIPLGSPLQDGKLAAVQNAANNVLERLHDCLNDSDRPSWASGVKMLSTLRRLSALLANAYITSLYDKALGSLYGMFSCHTQGFLSTLRQNSFEASRDHFAALQHLDAYNKELRQHQAVDHGLFARLYSYCGLSMPETTTWDQEMLKSDLLKQAQDWGTTLATQTMEANQEQSFAPRPEAIEVATTLTRFDQHLGSLCCESPLWNPIAQDLQRQARESRAIGNSIIECLSHADTSNKTPTNASWQALRNSFNLLSRAQAYSALVELEETRTLFNEQQVQISHAYEKVCDHVAEIVSCLAHEHVDAEASRDLCILMQLLRILDDSFDKECHAASANRPQYREQLARFEAAIRERICNAISTAQDGARLEKTRQALDQLLILLMCFQSNEVVRDAHRHAYSLLCQLATKQSMCQAKLNTILQYEANGETFRDMAVAIRELELWSWLDPMLADGRLLCEPTRANGDPTNEPSRSLSIANIQSVVEQTVEGLRECLRAAVVNVSSSLMNVNAVQPERELECLKHMHPVKQVIGEEFVDEQVALLINNLGGVQTRLSAFDISQTTEGVREETLQWLSSLTLQVEQLSSCYPMLRSTAWAALLQSLASSRAQIVDNVRALVRQLHEAVREKLASPQPATAGAELDLLASLVRSQDHEIQSIVDPVYNKAQQDLRRRFEELRTQYTEHMSAGGVEMAQTVKNVLISTVVLELHLPEVADILSTLEVMDAEAMTKVKDELSRSLADVDYDQVQGILTEVRQAAQQTPEWRAPFSTLCGLAKRELQRQTSEALNAAKRHARTCTRARAPTEARADALSQLDELDRFFFSLEVLHGEVTEPDLQKIDEGFAAIVLKVAEDLSRRLGIALAAYRFTAFHDLYLDLEAWECLSRNEAANACFLTIQNKVNTLSTDVEQHVRQLIAAADGVTLASVVQAFVNARDESAELLQHVLDLPALANRVCDWVSSAAEQELVAIQASLYHERQNLKVVEDRLDRYNRCFYFPLQSKSLPPFQTEQSRLSQDRQRLQKAMQNILHKSRYPALTPQVAHGLLQRLNTSKPEHMHAFIDVAKTTCQKAIEDILQGRSHNELGVKVTPDALDRLAGLTAFHAGLTQSTLNETFVQDILGEVLTTAERAIASQLHADLKQCFDSFVNWRILEAEAACETIQTSFDRFKALSPAASVPLEPLLAQVLSEKSVKSTTFQYGSDRVDQLSLTDLTQPSFQAKTLWERLQVLQRAAKMYEEQAPAIVVQNSRMCNPHDTLQKIQRHWSDLCQQVVAAVQSHLHAPGPTKTIGALHRVLTKLALDPQPWLEADLKQAQENVETSLMQFAAAAADRVPSHVAEKKWGPLNKEMRFSFDLAADLTSFSDASRIGTMQEEALKAELDKRTEPFVDDLEQLATCLVSMQELASNSISGHIKHQVKLLTTKRLHELRQSAGGNRRKERDNDLCLGQLLSRREHGRYGEEVKAGHPQFEAARIKQRQEATLGMGIDQALKEMTKPENSAKVSPAHANRLRDAYGAYRSEFESHMKNPNQVPRLVAQVQANCRKLAQTPSKMSQQLPGLLALLSAIWSLTSLAELAETTRTHHGIYKELHVVQVLALLELLGFGAGDDSLTRFGTWIKAFVGGQENKLGGAFVQVQTGGGKSIILGFACVLYALLGFDVSCACYSDILSSRDYKDFEAFFKTMGVHGNIRYSTMQALAERELNARGCMRTAVQRLIADNTLSKRKKPKASRPKILLVDEVDVLFAPIFLAETYNPLASQKDADFESILRTLWQDATLSLEQVINLEASQRLLQRYAHVHDYIMTTLKKLVKDRAAHAAEEHPYTVQNGRIAYDLAGLDQPSTSTFYGYETQYAYLTEEHRADEPNTIQSKFALHANAGNFSFFKMIQNFDVVGGLSGTLPDDMTVLKRELNVQRSTALPSMYGEHKLRRDRVQIVADSDRLHQQVAEECLKQSEGRAVIAFFKDTKDLQAFMASTPFKSQLAGLTINIIDKDQADIPQRIHQATNADTVTLATAPFGRGSDFVVLDRNIIDNGGVHVIQTFLSQDIAEEIQIQGRTARHSNPGSYRLILSLPDLKRLLGSDLLNSLTEGAYEGVPDVLDQARRNLHKETLNKLFDKLKACEGSHARSMQFMDALFAGPEGNVQEAIQLFLSHN